MALYLCQATIKAFQRLKNSFSCKVQRRGMNFHFPWEHNTALISHLYYEVRQKWQTTSLFYFLTCLRPSNFSTLCRKQYWWILSVWKRAVKKIALRCWVSMKNIRGKNSRKLIALAKCLLEKWIQRVLLEEHVRFLEQTNF